MVPEVDELDAQAHREEMRRRSRDEVESIAKLAGLEIRRVWELANGYWPLAPHYDSVRRPWWLLQTDIGLVRLGWRKRVLEIEWESCFVRGIALRGVVTDDNVTKGDTYVHAWSVEKAIEYMRALHALAGKS